MTGDTNRENLRKEVGLDTNAHVIMKPPPLGELKNLWQYVMSSKNKKKKISEQGQTSLKRKSPTDQMDDDNDINNGSKKHKLIWTTSLHNKFLEAIRVIGFNRAVPKKILEYMNVPELTRENVASHLQKYRIYLRRICDASVSSQNGIPENWNQRPFRSSFTWSQFPTLASNSYLLNYATALNSNENQKARVSTPNSVGTPELGGNNLKTTIPFADKKTSYFGASSAQGFIDSSLNTTYTPPLQRSSFLEPLKNDVLERVAAKCYPNSSFTIAPLNILESSMVNAPHIDNQGSSSGDSTIDRAQVSDQSQELTTIQGGFNSLSGTLGSDMGQASSNKNIVANGNNLMMEQAVGINLGDNIYDENNYVEHQKPIVNMPGFIEQRSAAVNMSFNFVEEPTPIVVNTSQATNMSNYMNPPSSIGMVNKRNVVTQLEPTTEANMSNFVRQQPPTFYMSGMRNFVEQRAGVVNMPNYLVTQQPQPVDAGINRMTEYMVPQPRNVSAFTNMSNLRNIPNNPNHHRVVIPNREMKKLSIDCEHEVMPNNMSSIITRPMITGNQQGINASASSSNVHQRGMQVFSQPGNWASSTTYDDHSMDHLGDYSDCLLSNNDSQADNKN